MPAQAARLPRDVIEALDRDGAICLRGAFDPVWIDLAAEGIRRNLEHPTTMFQRFAAEGQGGFYSDLWARRQIPQFERFALESPAAAIAAQCLGVDKVRLLQDTWFVKVPGTPVRTPWHHDNVVLGPFCSIWVALDPIPRDATLEFVRGSHRWDRLFMPASYFDNGNASLPAVEQFYDKYHGRFDLSEKAVFSLVPDIEANRDDYEILGWDLEPGDCLVFHARTLHGSPGNRLTHDTRRMVTRWVDETAVLAPHGGSVVERLAAEGFDVDLAVGSPIRGSLFPLVEPFS
ncbi:phytanoyl-CoA dioxygenase family protein [Rhodoplanes roseus]|uniref:Phytanoyl-CoA dioxygenase n=1 Tax=Rhodoplanes roseus TaxID=29409 RepID=A0A327L6A5_9BRAD|nr:phytanoyl-CoA dioxygenase family protein [Rhodoplanes roseus]RAI45734.1 phytanoyl-CoA dioxygenase [Rhodoplanes roseus]